MFLPQKLHQQYLQRFNRIMQANLAFYRFAQKSNPCCNKGKFAEFRRYRVSDDHTSMTVECAFSLLQQYGSYVELPDPIYKDGRKNREMNEVVRVLAEQAALSVDTILLQEIRKAGFCVKKTIDEAAGILEKRGARRFGKSYGIIVPALNHDIYEIDHIPSAAADNIYLFGQNAIGASSLNTKLIIHSSLEEPIAPLLPYEKEIPSQNTAAWKIERFAVAVLNPGWIVMVEP